MNDKDVLISTIIPTYNVGKYIEDCIQSLLKQDFYKIEYIFINDHSTDNSLDIINRYAEEDSRIRIINNPKNLGRGASRNIGIKAAKGKYLSFVDPDDCISDNFYQVLYQKAIETDCDIIKGQRALDNKLTDSNKRIIDGLKNNIPLFCFFKSEHQSAIYKSDFIKINKIEYGTSNSSQDKTFLLRLCLKNPSIAFVEDAIYYYFKRKESVTKEYTIQRCNYELDALEESIASLSVIQGDKNYYLYLRNTLYYIFKIFSKTFYYNKTYDQQLIDRFVNIIKSIHDYEILSKDFIELETLLRDNFFMPIAGNDTDLQLERMARQLEYLKYNNSSIKDLSFVLTKLTCRALIKSDAQEKKKLHTYIKENFSKLDTLSKITIYKNIPINIIRIIINKIKYILFMKGL